MICYLNITTYIEIVFQTEIIFEVFRKTRYIEKAGLEGFGPSTTGLRVRCATWLRHRPTEMNMPRVVINLKILKLTKLFILDLSYTKINMNLYILC